jgi:hypothetical protein
MEDGTYEQTSQAIAYRPHLSLPPTYAARDQYNLFRYFRERWVRRIGGLDVLADTGMVLLFHKAGISLK